MLYILGDGWGLIYAFAEQAGEVVQPSIQNAVHPDFAALDPIEGEIVSCDEKPVVTRDVTDGGQLWTKQGIAFQRADVLSDFAKDGTGGRGVPQLLRNVRFDSSQICLCFIR